MDTTGTPTSVAMAEDSDVVLKSLQEDMERSRAYIQRVAEARRAIANARTAARINGASEFAAQLDDSYKLFDEQVMQPALRGFNLVVDAYYGHLRQRATR